MSEEYYNIERRKMVQDQMRILRRKFLTYKEAELVYSISHKKLFELASKAEAIYRIDGTVLIEREIFDNYLEQFRERGRFFAEEDEE